MIDDLGKKLYIELITLKTVGSTFARMCDVEKRHPDFRWSEYPEIISKQCALNVRNHFGSEDESWLNESSDWAKNYAKILASYYVSVSCIENI